MHITLNGVSHATDSPTLADLVTELSLTPKGTAVAVGGAVIPHDRWSDTALREGDVVDVLTAIQGG